MKHIIFFFILFICSCKQIEKTYYDVEQIHITLDNDTIKASTFIKDAVVIKLETNDDCLIQAIFKIQYVNNKIFILDINCNSIFIFNKDGSFDKKLFKVGSGPGEYNRLIDFLVQDDFLYTMDFTTRSLLKYNMNLDYLGRINYRAFSSKFVVKGDILWTYNEPTGQQEDYQFTCIINNGDELNHCLPRNSINHIYNWGAELNIFSLSKNTIYTSPKYGSLVYHIVNNNMNPIYQIKFNTNNFPENENINEYDRFSQNFNYIMKENIYITDNFFIFDYFYKQYRNFCFYNMKNKSLQYGVVNNDLIKNFIFSPRWGNDNFLIETVESHHVIEEFPFLVKYYEQLKDIKSDDNPIIIIYSLQ